MQRSSVPALRGMATPGPFLPNFDELVGFTAREIPRHDPLLLLPGEDPFYFATGRTPQFPVTLFDPATDPYPASDLLAEALPPECPMGDRQARLADRREPHARSRADHAPG